jgi:hypothetical protein
MMHRVFWLMIAGGLVAGLDSTASAQNDLNGFGDFRPAMTMGWQYGSYPGGYNGYYSSNSVYTPAPRPGYSTYYSSGFYGGAPGATTYGPGVNYSASTAYPGGTYGYAGSYGRPPSAGYGYGSYPVQRRGMLSGEPLGRRNGYR